MFGLMLLLFQMVSYQKLTRDFFTREDVVSIAQDLLGKVLVHASPEGLTAGRIVETEAYRGSDDRACHAHGKRTSRTEIMYGLGGVSYVYLCYGIHHLFNIVTGIKDVADAILVRALEPLKGEELMVLRTGKFQRMTSGPGLVCKAMGISGEHYGLDLTTPQTVIWVEEGDRPVTMQQLISTTRIGVDYAGEDANRRWRFYEKGNQWVSRK